MKFLSPQTANMLWLLGSLPIAIAFLQPTAHLNTKHYRSHNILPVLDNIKGDDFDSDTKCDLSIDDSRMKGDDFDDETKCDLSIDNSRRLLFQSIVCAAALMPLSATAGKSEIDRSGQLFSPKSEMVRGGSDLTRGVRLEKNGKRSIDIKPGQGVQTVYETRFMAYLSRFLLTFDPAIRTWWETQGVDDPKMKSPSISISKGTGMSRAQASVFAEFAESVEVGLSDYFVGPYGSYGSVAAARAGINASKQVQSNRSNQGKRRAQTKAKQGVLNLYALLKARYTSIDAKRQLAILFTLISSRELQPTDEIRSLLGEADNAKITEIKLSKRPPLKNEAESRTSARRGGGYSINTPPKVIVDVPPALGSAFKRAILRPIMKPTSRVLKINVIDSGQGYTKIPSIKISPSDIGAQYEASACAILDRRGCMESIIVLDPGYGYGKSNQGLPPKVFIDPPKNKDGSMKEGARAARAEAELEYEITEIEIVDGGNGYVATEFPNIRIESPMEDPDWYVKKADDLSSLQWGTANVKEMEPLDKECEVEEEIVSDEMMSELRRDPLKLLPSAVRPSIVDTLKGSQYSVISLPSVTSTAVPSARYRAFDPIFGPIGKVPVTKGALELSTFEYTRLSLSGAVCTVIVRTLLNPLELVKTKIQLGNDIEINNYVLDMKNKNQDVGESRSKSSGDTDKSSGDTDKSSGDTDKSSGDTDKSPGDTETNEEVGTLDLIKSLISLRGFGSLFQSADITFLASLVFGSFGFGATELFRRFFTKEFFDAESSGQTGEELILIAAAALATIVTAAAAAPFEVLRVKSMGLVTAKGWREVLDLFIEEKKKLANSTTPFEKKDLLPLWGGFAPTVSRELPFALAKFLVFDLLAKAIVALINSNLGEGSIPIKVGTGTIGLTVSALSGAVAGVAGAIVSHPADLILTLTSASKDEDDAEWTDVVKELVSREGGISNLFIGLPARSVFFFLVIGLQFFLYDYVKTIFQVGPDDLSLVLDVFYAVRQGL